MPQIFQVLRCYKCLVFQVHQIKKSSKWECKMCGEKQSVKRHYGLGTAKDCRMHVQRLNGIRGEVDELKQNNIHTDHEFENVQPIVTIPETHLQKESRWSNYVEEAAPLPVDNNSSMHLNDTEVVLELPQRRKKMFSNNKNKIIKHQKVTEEINEVSYSMRNKNSHYHNQKSECELDDIKNRAIKSKACNETIDHTKQNDKHEKYLCTSGSFISEPTLSMESSHSAIKREVNNSKQIVKKFKPPSIIKNSKWAQYAEGDEEEEKEEIESTVVCRGGEQFCKEQEPIGKMDNSLSPCTEQSQNKFNTLFALCDDGDLDSVLDF